MVVNELTTTYNICIMKEKLWKIAEEYNLRTVYVTENWNGYPEHVQQAIVGFESWSEVTRFARKYDLEHVLLKKKDGWDMWVRNHFLYDVPELAPDDMGYDYMLEKGFDEQEFADNFLRTWESCDLTIEEIANYAKQAQEVCEAARDMEDDEVVFYSRTCGAPYAYDVCKKNPLSWHEEFGSYGFIVALMDSL